MGDRCFCSLRLLSEPTPELEKLLTEKTSWKDDHHNQWDFEDVNYGRIPDAIEEYLEENETPAIWINEAGYNYSAGVLFRNMLDRPWLKYPTVAGRIVFDVLPFPDIEELYLATQAQLILNKWEASAWANKGGSHV